MRVLFLSDLDSAHTVKWATALADRGVQVGIFGLKDCQHSLYDNQPNISIYSLGVNRALVVNSTTFWSKLRYIRAVPHIQRLLRVFRPDLVHAHFVTSYGLLGILSGCHPLLISAWGSDVLVFPNRSPLHRALVQFTLNRADQRLSTSRSMAQAMTCYTQKPIEITPFGVDTSCFCPQLVQSDLFNQNDIVIGTIKALYEYYGVEYLIRAFALLKQKCPEQPLKLLIVGDGPLAEPLQQLAIQLGVQAQTVFTGRVSPDQVVKYHNMLSIFVALSNSESFGVSILEASACGKPVVVSNVDGLPEVVKADVTGFVVPPRNPEQAALALEALVLDQDLRLQMGHSGREWVIDHYDLADNVQQMIDIYERFVQ